jgi:endonuclease/exonuclease/phosphatase family metal-dependent hydrolase
VALLVRTWNVFHGNAFPPERRSYLREAIELLSADGPDLVFLQELPAWALERLDEWSGMRSFGAVAARPKIGPLPSTAELGRRLTSLHHGYFRSAFSGQGNAILAAPALQPVGEQETIVLNERSFRRAQARWLGLDLVTRLAWAKERRVCQALPLGLGEGRTALVANLHATAARDRRLADAELFRAATFVDALAEPAELSILAGDFNITRETSRTLADLTAPDWGFAGGGPLIDHVLVRGASAGPPHVWPPDRRRVRNRFLSDHAPVELRIDL